MTVELMEMLLSLELTGWVKIFLIIELSINFEFYPSLFFGVCGNILRGEVWDRVDTMGLIFGRVVATKKITQMHLNQYLLLEIVRQSL